MLILSELQALEDTELNMGKAPGSSTSLKKKTVHLNLSVQGLASCGARAST